jgi:hypothetical protein
MMKGVGGVRGGCGGYIGSVKDEVVISLRVKSIHVCPDLTNNSF